jgi:hypothetical protein
VHVLGALAQRYISLGLTRCDLRIAAYAKSSRVPLRTSEVLRVDAVIIRFAESKLKFEMPAHELECPGYLVLHYSCVHDRMTVTSKSVTKS